MRMAILVAVLGGFVASCGSSMGGEKERILDLGDNLPLKLILIPSGKFLMGSPEEEKRRARDKFQQREVTITKDSYMGCCEVTR